MQATVLYNANQPSAAAKLLTPVWHTIEKSAVGPGIREEVILGACFLLIAADFSCKLVSRVAGRLLYYREKVAAMENY